MTACMAFHAGQPDAQDRKCRENERELADPPACLRKLARMGGTPGVLGKILLSGGRDARGPRKNYFPSGMLPSRYFKSSSRQRMPPPRVKAVWFRTLSTPLRRKIVGVVGFSWRKMYSP